MSNGNIAVDENAVEMLNPIVKYKVSEDGVGLLAYFKNGGYYHIRSDELTKLEKWILKLLKNNGRQ